MKDNTKSTKNLKNPNFSDDLWYMSIAIEEAEKAAKLGEVPVGAIIVSNHGKVLSRTHNLKESIFNPCGHAELLSIISATKTIQNWRLTDATIYVTLEPCHMCLGALVQSRISRLVFGAYDSKGGAISLGSDLYKDKRLNHNFSVTGGIKHMECSKVLSQFFKERRKLHKKT